MQVTLVLSLTFLSIVNARAEKDDPPPNAPPQLWRASATEQRGKVKIQIARPQYKTPRKAVSAEAMKWRELRQVTLGDSVRAFGVDGKPMESKAVLKTLRKPTGVAVFVRFYEPLLDPDPFYLAMLREGTVVFVVGADALAEPIP